MLFELTYHLTENLNEVALLVTFFIVEFKHVYLVFQLGEVSVFLHE